MADPHIQSPMDIWDKLGVVVYRSGFVVATVAFALLPWQPTVAYLGLFIAATLTASSLHIYMKSVRTILQYSAWIGLVVALLGAPLWGLGFALVTLGGLAFKENFCFKVIGLNFQPIICFFLWLSLALHWSPAVMVLALVSALLFAQLSVKKMQMPLHFDIGDKTKYEN